MTSWKNNRCAAYEDRYGNIRCGVCCEPLYCADTGDMPEICPSCGAPITYAPDELH